MINITAWGMFWAGFFGFLALCELAEIIRRALKCHAIIDSAKHLSQIDPEIITELIEILLGKEESD